MSYGPYTDEILAHMVLTISLKEKRYGKIIGKQTISYKAQDIEKIIALFERQCLTLLMAHYDPCSSTNWLIGTKLYLRTLNWSGQVSWKML